MSKKHKQPRLFLPNNPLAPQLCPDLAEEIGLNESVLLLQWEFWMRTDGIERDGYLWLQRSVREIKQTFVFWGIGTIHRTIKSLESKGYLVSAESDDQTGQSAPLFRFDFDRLTQLKTIKVVFQDGTGGVPDCSKSVPTRNTSPYKKKEEEIKIPHAYKLQPIEVFSIDDVKDPTVFVDTGILELMVDLHPDLRFHDYFRKWWLSRKANGGIGRRPRKTAPLADYTADIEAFFQNCADRAGNGSNGHGTTSKGLPKVKITTPEEIARMLGPSKR